jgi:proline iminopeptidase
VRRWFSGQLEPRQMLSFLMKIGDLYDSHPSLLRTFGTLLSGGWRSRMRGETFVHSSRHLMPGWSVVDRLDRVLVPTLVMAGSDDFIFPPACQSELASRIPDARLHLVPRAGHNPHDEQPTETFAVIADFLATGAHTTAGPIAA